VTRPAAGEADGAAARYGVDRRAMATLSAGHLFTDISQGSVPALLLFLSYGGMFVRMLARPATPIDRPAIRRAA